MNKAQWILLLLGLDIFFLFFGIYKFSEYNPSELPVQIILKVEENPHEAFIHYRIENLTDKTLSQDKYFFRLSVGRQFNAGAFVIKEFSKELKPYETFSSSTRWPKIALTKDPSGMTVYFNMYEDKTFSYPKVVSSAQTTTTLPALQIR